MKMQMPGAAVAEEILLQGGANEGEVWFANGS